MKKLNRWVYAALGVLILLFAGMVYAWSVLSGPIAQEFPEWTKAQLSLTFTIVMILFCVGCMVGGFLSGKVSAKIYVWAAAVMFLGGFMLSARITSLMGLYIGFGVICGFASGLAYNAVMGTISRWFPDKQGLISGVLLMGFGLSSFLVGKIYQMCTVEGVMSQTDMDAMMYKIDGEDLYLIGTSEHSMIGKFIDQILPEDKLPQTLTSYSPCFRKEKGARIEVLCYFQKFFSSWNISNRKR